MSDDNRTQDDKMWDARLRARNPPQTDAHLDGEPSCELCAVGSKRHSRTPACGPPADSASICAGCAAIFPTEGMIDGPGGPLCVECDGKREEGIVCATCQRVFSANTLMVNGIEGPRCIECNRKNNEKDYGPLCLGQMMGVCIASYLEHGVTKLELLDLVGDLYDGIAKVRAEAMEEMAKCEG